MTTFTQGLDYDELLDVLAHAISSVEAGTYAFPSLLQVDDMGHIIDIEAGSAGSSYLEGLTFSFNSVTSFTVNPGAAFVPGLNRVVELESPVNVPQFSNAANGLTYAYLTEVNGVGTIVTSDVGPDAPYLANARFKVGAPTQRYIGFERN